MINPVKRPKGARKDVFQKKDLLGTIKARGSNTKIQTQRMTAAIPTPTHTEIAKNPKSKRKLIEAKIAHQQYNVPAHHPASAANDEIFRALLSRRIDPRQKNKYGNDSSKYQTRCRDYRIGRVTAKEAGVDCKRAKAVAA
jgi:hypothetical protein